MDNNEEVILETEPSLSRKRKSCPAKWKRNVAKKARYVHNFFEQVPIYLFTLGIYLN